MNYLMLKLLGRLYMDEASPEGGDGGGGLAAAPAALTPAETAAPAAEAGSLLGDLAKPVVEAEKPAAEVKQEADKAADLPETYQFTLPDGIELDEAAAPLVQELFKELGLPQEKAQAIMDKLLAIDQSRQQTPEQAEQQQFESISNLNKTWTDECSKLPDIGGENFQKSLEISSRAMVKFATPELRQMLNQSALGSNPEFFKFIHAIGSSMSPDTMEHSGETTNVSKRPADVMFGDIFNK
jgi:hypothetical protein